MTTTLETALFYMQKAYREKNQTRKQQYQQESIRLYEQYKQGK